MTYWQNIENLLITHFIKSSHIFEDSDSDDSKDSDEEQFDAEDDEVILLGLCSLLDSRYLKSCTYNSVAKSQEWWHLIIPRYDNDRFKKIMRMDAQSFQNLITKIEVTFQSLFY